MKNILNSFLSLFFPHLCCVCKKRLSQHEKHICLDCLAQLPKTNYHNQPENRLVDFFAGRFSFQRAAAFAYFVKGGSIQQIVHELKYNNNAELGVFMGELCGATLKNGDFISDIDFLVPVPLHPKRQMQRGYNQAHEIAKGIAVKTTKQIDTTTLVRTVNNPSQTKNSRFERWANVEDVFSITDSTVFENKHILLIDDVITTGSTIEACAKEILKCEGSKVSILAIGVAG